MLFLFLELLLHTRVSIINSYFYSTIVEICNGFSSIWTDFMSEKWLLLLVAVVADCWYTMVFSDLWLSQVNLFRKCIRYFLFLFHTSRLYWFLSSFFMCFRCLSLKNSQIRIWSVELILLVPHDFFIFEKLIYKIMFYFCNILFFSFYFPLVRCFIKKFNGILHFDPKGVFITMNVFHFSYAHLVHLFLFLSKFLINH